MTDTNTNVVEQTVRIAADGVPAIAPGESRVEITLVEDAGDTIMTLRHSGLPDEFAELHASGWSQFLTLLVAAADGR